MRWTAEFRTIWWAGVRVALLRKVPRERLRAGWVSLWLLVLLYAVGGYAADYLTTPPPRVFYVEALWAELTWLSVVLLISFLVALPFGASGRVAEAAAAFYAILWLPGLAFQLSYGLGNDWRLELALWLWVFVCIYRWLTSLFAGGVPARAAALVFVIVSVTVAEHFHSDVAYDYWYQDDAEESPSPLDLVEHDLLFQGQADLLRTELDALAPSRPGETDLYAIVAGSDGGMGVFMREAIFVRGVLDRDLLRPNRSVLLVNHADTLATVPLATLPNLASAVQHVAGLMQPEEDLLLLYLTSHGARNGALHVSLGNALKLHAISARDLDQVLDEAGIRWRMLIVSACFSGKMIEALGDLQSLVITSAAADRVSYGCADDAPLTYFARAFFEEAAPRSAGDLARAYQRAAALIAAREAAEGIGRASLPQIHIGEQIRAKLAALDGAAMAFAPAPPAHADQAPATP